MITANPVYRPIGAAALTRMGRLLMDVILHLGAHRTGTTTFQHYVRDHAEVLDHHRIGFWGPARMRKSVLPGLFRTPGTVNPLKTARRAEGRIAMLTQRAEDKGIDQLLVSDENMIGSASYCFRKTALYPAIGERVARIAAGFRGRVRRVILSVRAQDLWWASAAALLVARGHPMPSNERLYTIAASARSWRNVITDLACALPEADIRVLPFETYVGRPEGVLQVATGLDMPTDSQMRWLNRSATLPELRARLAEQGSNPEMLPDRPGRWQPFTPEQSARLAENYADDLFWLRAGADGLATLTEDPARIEASTDLPAGLLAKGQSHGTQGHELAQPG